MVNCHLILLRRPAGIGSRISERGVHVAVSQNGLYAPDRHPGIEQQGGGSVAQWVWGGFYLADLTDCFQSGLAVTPVQRPNVPRQKRAPGHWYSGSWCYW